MKPPTKNPLTAAAACSLFLLASAGTTLFADEREDYDYSSRGNTNRYDLDANVYVPHKIARKDHFTAKAFVGIALEDDCVEGDDCSLSIGGVSLEYAHTIPAGKKVGIDFVARVDLAYGHDDWDGLWYDQYGYSIRNIEYTLLMMNWTVGVDFSVELNRFRFYAGPRAGLGLTWTEWQYDYRYYGRESDDETNAGIVVGLKAGWDIRITERSAIALELGYMMTTAVPDTCEDQSYLMLGVGYRHSF